MTHRSQAIIKRSSSYFVLHTQYNLSSSCPSSSSSSSCFSAFGSPSGPTDPVGIVDAERDRDTVAFFKEGAVDVFVVLAGAKATTGSSASFCLGFGTGFARGLAAVLGFAGAL
jgi:hypothetical protein